MFKPSKYINEICPSCHPREYVKTLAEYTGEFEVIDVEGVADASYIEYLYKCCQCGAKVWVDEEWIRNNAAAAPKTIKQRQEYISRKGRQLDAITDDHKYSHRLARIMRYHKLLTDLEMATVDNLMKGDEKR